MRRPLLVMLLLGLLVAGCGPSVADRPRTGPAADQVRPGASAPSAAQPAERVVVATASPSLSWLPAQIAGLQGYFREEGLDVEFVQVGGTLIVPALLSGEVQYTTILSAVGTHAANGGPSRIVQYHSVRLQHVLSVRPEFTAIGQLAGKRIAVQSLGTLTAFEARKIADHFGLPDVAIVPIGGDLERIAAMATGAADANVTAIPNNLVAEREGFPTLLRIGTVLEVPQAGFATSEAHLRDRSDQVTRLLRAAARALPLITSQRDLTVATIADWMELSPADAARAYEQVADTYSPNGLPTDAQMAAYLELLRDTAGVSADVSASQIVDFTIARRVAAELGLSGP